MFFFFLLGLNKVKMCTRGKGRLMGNKLRCGTSSLTGGVSSCFFALLVGICSD